MTPIYHFTHITNLEKVIEAGALLCDSLCRASGQAARNIAYPNLKEQRAITLVEVPPGETLDKYVPFYFGTRSPMLFTYKNGNVTGKPENQDDIIYFATTAETIVQNGFPFAFTDGHPIREPKAFYNDLRDLEQVDLPLMEQKYWNDTDADPDRKRRRQAEFLVWERVPLPAIMALGARTESVRLALEEIVMKHSLGIRCIKRPGWYYG
ncbi:DUF4433 domain-containing protein [Plantactinospora sp. BC1]|uniref:type II toxin-antitoxin system toxin DNA ADP-ribosyl transferase DarT n=1 Tax=Plantactinospora sp. BC1 TaxID=2108470 RepID=UPI000D17E6AE|nr:DUF4433 domain-containing protein [Plantactinospora sp. BC1]AVT29874.1 DUF4433 domain-containing protein [Plantactinospora sp. BC1]